MWHPLRLYTGDREGLGGPGVGGSRGALLHKTITALNIFNHHRLYSENVTDTEEVTREITCLRNSALDL